MISRLEGTVHIREVAGSSPATPTRLDKVKNLHTEAESRSVAKT